MDTDKRPATPWIAVIGGGPAGLMAAETAAAAGLAVTVYDRMPSVGRKLQLAGRGGLNLTHTEPLPRFVTRYGPAAAALAPALAAFPPEALRAWAEALGQPCFVGSSGRVFPVAMKATPLLRAWLARLAASGVRFALRHRWLGWDEAGGLRFTTPDGERRANPAATILAMGGASWPRLGSDGAWVAPVTRAGVGVARLRAANCGFSVAWSDHFRSRFEGEPLKRIALSFGGQTARGEALVTAHGLEGGAVYTLSGAVREAIAAAGPATVTLDLRPDLSLDALAQPLSQPTRGQSLANILRKSAGLPPVAIGLLREGGALPPAGAQGAALAALIKRVPLRLTGPSPIERAISSAGGIALAELDAHFMLARRPGVFAAGEMLDWEAPTGGYLLQGSFSSGMAAANGALAWLTARNASRDPI